MQDGMYEITGDQLARLGANLSVINPSTIRLFAYPAGMLPQANAVGRLKDLQEVTIEVVTEATGRFGKRDKVIFFGQGPDVITYDRLTRTYRVTNHLYSEKNHYFLTFGEVNGKRVGTVSTTDPPAISSINTWDDYYYNETDLTNILKSGRDWFGTAFDANTLATFNWDMDRVTPGSTVRIVTRLMAEAYQDARFKVTYNNSSPAEYPIQAIPQTSYGIKGRTRTDTLVRPADASLTRHTLRFEYVRGGTNYSIGRLDYFTATVNRNLAYTGKPFIFTATDAIGFAGFNIATSTDARVWNVSEPFTPVRMISVFGDGSLSFDGPAGETIRYAVFNPGARLLTATEGIRVSNQNLQGITSPDIITIAHPLFVTAATMLASHRLKHDGLSTAVVTPQQIYNEYSGGRADVTAIRDFVRDIWLRSGKKLKHLLLFGKGSYDYRNLTPGNQNFVPVYESVNSLAPLETYSSDDFFGFLEDHEGNWGEKPSEFHTLDIGIGRIPCTTTEQADAIVRKLIAYDTDPRLRGDWRKEIIFVADDGDGNVHQSQANQLAGIVETKRPDLHAQRLFLDLYKQEPRSFGQVSPQASNALFRAFHEGGLIINFTGHGSEQLWMAERMLDPERIETLNNRDRWPFLVTATCAFGRTDDPLILSSAERLLLRRSSGSIGLVTSARPVSSSTNFDLNADFYNAMFADPGLAIPTAGEVFRRTKNARDSQIANRNFSLLGDPAMTLAFPKLEAVVTALEGPDGSANLKGLAPFTVKGEVRRNGITATNHNGTMDITLYREPVNIITRGDENPKFEFSEWGDMLFRGTATVKDGLFRIDFTAPASLSAGSGKIILHGTEADGGADAGGYRFPLTVSGTNQPSADSSPPTVALYIGDRTFTDGSTVPSDLTVLIDLADQTGIDVSADGDRGLKLTLDGDTTLLIGRYFRSNADGKSGVAAYSLFGLNDGQHRISVTAHDLAGNSVTREIRFTVGETALTLFNLNGAPNPVRTSTGIYFEHDRPGDDLEGTLNIHDREGRPVNTISFRIDNAQVPAFVQNWDGTDGGGKKLPSGLYILQLIVRSGRDGAKNSLAGKLILSD